MEPGELILRTIEVLDELVFTYRKEAERTFFYISDPLNGSIIHRESISEQDEYNLPLENLNKGFYDLVVVDGDQVIAKRFEKI